jgi:hypothetical protein
MVRKRTKHSPGHPVPELRGGAAGARGGLVAGQEHSNRRLPELMPVRWMIPSQQGTPGHGRSLPPDGPTGGAAQALTMEARSDGRYPDL